MNNFNYSSDVNNYSHYLAGDIEEGRPEINADSLVVEMGPFLDSGPIKQILTHEQAIQKFIEELPTYFEEIKINITTSELDTIKEKLAKKLSNISINLSKEELIQLACDVANLNKYRTKLETEEIVDTFLTANEIASKTEQSKSATPTMEELKALDQEISKLEKRFEKLISKTIFWRCTRGELNPKLKETDPKVAAEQCDITLGIIDGEWRLFVSSKDLRPVPFSKLQTGLAIAGFGLATAGSYYFSGEGIITKALASGFAGFSVPVLNKIPNIFKISGAAAATTGAYYADKVLDTNYIKLALLTGVITTVLLKKFGKDFSSGKLKGLIPKPVSEKFGQLKDKIQACFNKKQDASEAELEGIANLADEVVESSEKIKRSFVPISDFALQYLPNLPFEITANLTLSLDYVGGDINYALKIDGEKQKEYTIGDASDKDDDDDDDDEKPAKAVPLWKELAVVGISGIATGASTYYLGQGITTEAANTIFSASVKAKLRLSPLVNSMVALGVPAAALLALKLFLPGSLVGELSFIPISIAINTMKKLLKDSQTGKRRKNMSMVKIPLSVQYVLSKYCGYNISKPSNEPLPFEELLRKGQRDSIVVQINPQMFDSSKKDCVIDLVLKIAGEKLTGKYLIDKETQEQVMKENGIEVIEKKSKKKEEVESADLIVDLDGNGAVAEVKPKKKGKKKADTSLESQKVKLKREVREILGLAQIKPEKPGKWRELAYYGASAAATLGASYLTQKVSMQSVEGMTRIRAEDLGEGVIPSLLSKIVSTAAKQSAKNWPVYPREIGTMGAATAALAVEQLLFQSGKEPFRFAFLPVGVALAVKGKQAKNFMFGKEFSKKGYLTSDWPKEDPIIALIMEEDLIDDLRPANIQALEGLTGVGVFL